MLNAMRKYVQNYLDSRKILAFAPPSEIQPKELPADQVLAQARHKISPWVEDGQATFLYFGQSTTKHVELIAEITGWHSRGMALKRIDNLFHLTLKLPADSRLEYKFLVDGEWYCDPLNSRRAENGIGGMNSSCAMPNHQENAYVRHRPNVLHGRLVQREWSGTAIPGKRQVYVYLPHEYDRSQRRYPVIYVHDGGDYLHRAQLHTVLDNLIADGLIEPVIAVCINPIDRFHEYTMNPDYCHLLVKEIVPWVDEKFRTLAAPDKRTLLGASLGGLISTFMAFHYPHIFGAVFGQSSSYQFFSERMVEMVAQSQPRPLHLFLTAGRFEGLLAANRRMHTTLAQQGYNFQYSEMNEGHNWTNWSHHLAEGLCYFFGKP